MMFLLCIGDNLVQIQKLESGMRRESRPVLMLKDYWQAQAHLIKKWKLHWVQDTFLSFAVEWLTKGREVTHYHWN